MFRRGEAVQLTVDLSPYYSALRIGAVGTVVGPSKRGYEPVVRVRFPAAGVRDIRLAYLQPAGTHVMPAATQAATAATAEAPPAETAVTDTVAPGYRDAVLVVGPRGGYRSLTFVRTEGSQSETVSLSSKAAIEKALAELEAQGVSIQREEG